MSSGTGLARVMEMAKEAAEANQVAVEDVRLIVNRGAPTYEVCFQRGEQYCSAVFASDAPIDVMAEDLAHAAKALAR